MNLEEMTGPLRTPSDDPPSLAMAGFDAVLATEPKALRRVAEAAAIPHWFDPEILAQLLDDDLRPAAADWHGQILKMPFCKPFPQRNGHNIHESTRLALRTRLAAQDPERFATLTRRAVAAFSGTTTPHRVERMFHRLWENPEQAGPEIRQLEYDLRSKVEGGLALADTLAECLSQDSAPPLVQCWALWTAGMVRAPYLNIGEQMDLANRAVTAAKTSGSDFAFAAAAILAGGVLCERGQAGDADRALNYYQRALDIRERFLAANPDSAQAARDVSLSLEKLADFLADRGLAGDADKALNYYQCGLDVLERLLAANPESALAARDVSISLNKLADFLANRGLAGDTDKALNCSQRALDICERLLAANPESAQAARDVSLSLESLADLLANRGLAGDADKALSYYQRDLDISERLLAANPESALAARDVSVSLNKLAGFLANRGLAGDADKALSYYQRDLDISERLLAANPESALAARDVSVSLNKLAGFLANRGLAGDVDKALSYHQRDLDITERLLAANPESALAAGDVSLSLNKLADLLANRGLAGDADKALSCFQRDVDICERLLAANPDSAQAARDVSVSLQKLADFLAIRGLAGDADKALSCYQRGLDVRERLLAANPNSARAARDVVVSHFKFFRFHSAAGNQTKALESGRACFAMLDSFMCDGRPMDPRMRGLYEQLKPMFGGMNRP